jgi:hypothetical protein
LILSKKEFLLTLLDKLLGPGFEFNTFIGNGKVLCGSILCRIFWVTDRQIYVDG